MWLFMGHPCAHDLNSLCHYVTQSTSLGSSQGHVAVMKGTTEMLAMLGKGGFFGELALLATARRTAQVGWSGSTQGGGTLCQLR